MSAVATKRELWICTECGSEHHCKSEADACCNSVYEAYACAKCGSYWSESYEAWECCGTTGWTCGGCGEGYADECDALACCGYGDLARFECSGCGSLWVEECDAAACCQSPDDVQSDRIEAVRRSIGIWREQRQMIEVQLSIVSGYVGDPDEDLLTRLDQEQLYKVRLADVDKAIAQLEAELRELTGEDAG